MKVQIPILALLLCLGLTPSAEAQQRELSVEAAYPLPVGDTFLSKYNGQAGAGAIFSQPLTDRLSLRIGGQYNRLRWDRAGTDVNVYTPRVGLAYMRAISDRMTLAPEAGLSYTHFGFQYAQDVIPSSKRSLNGGGFWIGLTPRYRLGEQWALGITTEYRATFFIEPTDQALDTPYNRQYHALVFGIVGTYRF